MQNLIPSHAKRLQRILRWATLWLMWAGEFVAGTAQRFRATRFLETPDLERLLARVTDIVGFLLLGQAMLRVASHSTRKLPNSGRFCSRAQIARAFLGALRRRLRSRDIADRIANLTRLLKNRTRAVAWLARRIARGFTQVHVFSAHRESAPALPRLAFDTPCLDTS